MFKEYTDDFLHSSSCSKETLFPSENILFRISLDNTTRKFILIARYNSDLKKAISYFSTPNVQFFYSKVYGGKIVKSRNLVINKFGYFPIGMFFTVVSYLKSTYPSDCIALSENVRRFILEWLTPLRKNVLELPDTENFQVSTLKNSDKYTLRDYQYSAIKRLIINGYGRGLVELPTGSGKSYVIATFIKTVIDLLKDTETKKLKTLILVPNRQLVEQFYTDLKDYGYDKKDITRLTSDLPKKERFNPDASVIIANRQYLFTNAEKLPPIDILVADEAHTISPDSKTYQLVDDFLCKIKVGFSGTLPRDTYKKWMLIGLFSNILYEKSIVDLQQKGILTDIEFLKISTTDKTLSRNALFSLRSNQRYNVIDSDFAYNRAYLDELDYMTNNCERLFSQVLDTLIEKTQECNTLILFERIEFGKQLFDILQEKTSKAGNVKVKSFYIDGSTPIEERENIRSLFEKTNNNILIAQSATFSTGINIKNLSILCFTGGGKSIVKCVQSIGRILRKHENKQKAYVVDCVFNFKYSQKHFKERLKLYKNFYGKTCLDNEVIIDVD